MYKYKLNPYVQEMYKSLVFGDESLEGGDPILLAI